MSWRTDEKDERETSETEYIPTDDEEDINDGIKRIHRELEDLYEREENLRKELRKLEELRLKRREL